LAGTIKRAAIKKSPARANLIRCCRLKIPPQPVSQLDERVFKIRSLKGLGKEEGDNLLK
jgi:hypothetical protein